MGRTNATRDNFARRIATTARRALLIACAAGTVLIGPASARAGIGSAMSNGDASSPNFYSAPGETKYPAPLARGPAELAANSEIYKKVGVDQKLDNQVPLDLTFRDSTGKEVKLDEYFHHGKPVVLSLVYYECPMLCTMTLNGMVGAFKVLNLSIGKDYDVVTVSFNPRETSELAAKKKANYVKEYHRDGAADGWHFMTGDEANIAKLADSVGFRYFYDTRTKQYGHTSAIMVLTPEGKVSRYFYGLEYAPKDLRLGLIEASQNKIGTLADSVVLLCYHYDPMTGKYGLAITRLLRGAGLLTVLGISGFIVVMSRRERRVPLTAQTVAAGAGGGGDGDDDDDGGGGATLPRT